MVDNPMYAHNDDFMGGSRMYLGGRGATTMSSSSNASTRHMLGVTTPFTRHMLGVTTPVHSPHTTSTIPRGFSHSPPNSRSYAPATPEVTRYPVVTPPTPELQRYPRHYKETSRFGTHTSDSSKYGTNYTKNSNYRMSFNNEAMYGTNAKETSRYGSHTEASRYDPNFTLGKASPSQPKKLEPRRNESRYMVRPKLRPEAKLDPRFHLHPPTPELPRTMVYGGGEIQSEGKKGKGSGLYDWHIPRATLWCAHKAYDNEPCKQCQLKWDSSGEGSGSSREADSASMCSSINPPPTFTALDNYRPVRPRPRCHQCSCGIIFAITTLFSLLVLLLIMGFIIYIEMVLKHQTANVTDRM